MSYYSNPTANAAMGAVDREIRIMKKRAKEIRRLRKQCRLTPQMQAEARKQFPGIFCRFYLEALEDKPKQKGSRKHGCPSLRPDAHSHDKLCAFRQIVTCFDLLSRFTVRFWKKTKICRCDQVASVSSDPLWPARII